MVAVNGTLVSKLTLNGLIWGRMTFGVAAWLAPRSVGNAVGLDMSGNPQAVYLARMLAVRDLVLACGALRNRRRGSATVAARRSGVRQR